MDNATLALSQPDWHAKPNCVRHSEEHGEQEKNDSYTNINITVYRGEPPTDSGPPEDSTEVIGSDSGECKQVVVTVMVGPAPLVVSVADYGGEGEPFLLRGYATAPLRIEER